MKLGISVTSFLMSFSYRVFKKKNQCDFQKNKCTEPTSSSLSHLGGQLLFLNQPEKLHRRHLRPAATTRSRPMGPAAPSSTPTAPMGAPNRPDGAQPGRTVVFEQTVRALLSERLCTGMRSLPTANPTTKPFVLSCRTADSSLQFGKDVLWKGAFYYSAIFSSLSFFLLRTFLPLQI